MKKITSILALLCLPILFTSCQKVAGNGETVTQNRDLPAFTEIGLSLNADAILTNGPEYSVEVLAQENLLPYIETNVNGSQLFIRLRKGVVLGHHDPIRILISAPGITGLSVSGSGNIRGTSEWQGSTLRLEISGSGNISMLSVTGSSLSATISGSGNMDVTGGAVEEETLKISGSGTISLQGLRAGMVHAQISGSGNMYAFVHDYLDGGISGSGDIYYYGDPQVNVHVSGSGTVRKMD
jgi:hypothetical protein